MAFDLRSEGSRRALAVANFGAAALSAWLAWRVLTSGVPEAINVTALVPVSVPLVMAPWLIFAGLWWKSEGWREVARRRPKAVKHEATFFVFANLLQLVALPWLFVSNVRGGWLVTVCLPLLQLLLLSFLRVGLRIWLRLGGLLDE